MGGSGSKAKKVDTPPFNAGSSDEEKFIKYVEPEQIYIHTRRLSNTNLGILWQKQTAERNRSIKVSGSWEIRIAMLCVGCVNIMDDS